VDSLRSLQRKIDDRDLAAAKDTVLLSSARGIYQKYRERLSRRKVPAGVAIHRDTYRGQLIFHKKPILLPGESFIPVERLNSQQKNYNSEIVFSQGNFSNLSYYS